MSSGDLSVVASGGRADFIVARAFPVGGWHCRRGPARANEVVEVRVPVPNREGVLAEVATLASELGVNIESLETADATRVRTGLIVMVVDVRAGPACATPPGWRRDIAPTLREVG